MSLTLLQTGLYNTHRTVIFPHAPIDLDRWGHGAPATALTETLGGAVVTEYIRTPERHRFNWMLREVPAAVMAQLQAIKEDGGIVYAKPTPGSNTEYLCVFDPEQGDWRGVAGDYPNAKDDGQPVSSVFTNFHEVEVHLYVLGVAP